MAHDKRKEQPIQMLQDLGNNENCNLDSIYSSTSFNDSWLLNWLFKSTRRIYVCLSIRYQIHVVSDEEFKTSSKSITLTQTHKVASATFFVEKKTLRSLVSVIASSRFIFDKYMKRIANICYFSINKTF